MGANPRVTIVVPEAGIAGMSVERTGFSAVRQAVPTSTATGPNGRAGTQWGCLDKIPGKLGAAVAQGNIPSFFRGADSAKHSFALRFKPPSNDSENVGQRAPGEIKRSDIAYRTHRKNRTDY